MVDEIDIILKMRILLLLFPNGHITLIRKETSGLCPESLVCLPCESGTGHFLLLQNGLVMRPASLC